MNVGKCFLECIKGWNNFNENSDISVIDINFPQNHIKKIRNKKTFTEYIERLNCSLLINV